MSSRFAGFFNVAILYNVSKVLMYVWNMMNFIPLIVKEIPIFLSYFVINMYNCINKYDSYFMKVKEYVMEHVPE